VKWVYGRIINVIDGYHSLIEWSWSQRGEYMCSLVAGLV